MNETEGQRLRDSVSIGGWIDRAKWSRAELDGLMSRGLAVRFNSQYASIGPMFKLVHALDCDMDESCQFCSG